MNYFPYCYVVYYHMLQAHCEKRGIHVLIFLSPAVTLPCCLHAFSLQPTPCRAPCRRMVIVKSYTLWPYDVSLRFAAERKQKF